MSRRLSQDVLEQKWAVWEALSSPNPPTFEGLPNENLKVWLGKMERGSPLLGIPEEQWIETAVYFLRGVLKLVMKEAKDHIEFKYEDKSPEEQWRMFKETLQDLHKRYKDLVGKSGTFLLSSALVAACALLYSIDTTPGSRGGGEGGDGKDQSKKYLDLAAGGLLIAGSSVILPSLGVLALNAVGFTAGGVVAGSVAAAVQSAVYGASTGGVFSVLQSIGATAVVAGPVGLVVGAAAMVTAAGIARCRHSRL